MASAAWAALDSIFSPETGAMKKAFQHGAKQCPVNNAVEWQSKGGKIHRICEGWKKNGLLH